MRRRKTFVDVSPHFVHIRIVPFPYQLLCWTSRKLGGLIARVLKICLWNTLVKGAYWRDCEPVPGRTFSAGFSACSPRLLFYLNHLCVDKMVLFFQLTCFGDPRKKFIALGKTYFAVMARQQEVADAFDLLRLLLISERDVRAGRTKSAKQVFQKLRKELKAKQKKSPPERG